MPAQSTGILASASPPTTSQPPPLHPLVVLGLLVRSGRPAQLLLLGHALVLEALSVVLKPPGLPLSARLPDVGNALPAACRAARSGARDGPARRRGAAHEPDQHQARQGRLRSPAPAAAGDAAPCLAAHLKQRQFLGRFSSHETTLSSGSCLHAGIISLLQSSPPYPLRSSAAHGSMRGAPGFTRQQPAWPHACAGDARPAGRRHGHASRGAQLY